MPKIKLVSANNSNYFQDNKIEKGTARPTSGTYTKGDIMINTGSDAARTPMWICIASGTPGSWSAVTVGAANNATTTSDGLMSKEDKVKLNGIANNANNYVHPGSGTNPHGTTKADVGLGSVNNWSATSATNDSSTTTYATAAAVKAAMDKANEAFQSANNGKNTIATAIGSPVSASDTFTAMGTKIDTLTQTFRNNLTNKGVDVTSNDKIPQLIAKIPGISAADFSSYTISVFKQSSQPTNGNIGDIWIKDTSVTKPIFSMTQPLTATEGDLWLAMSNLELKTKFESVTKIIKDFPNPMIFDIVSGKRISSNSGNLFMSNDVADIYTTFASAKRYTGGQWIWSEVYVKKAEGWVLLKNEFRLYMQCSSSYKLYRYNKNLDGYDKETTETFTDLRSLTCDLEGNMYISTGANIKKYDGDLRLIMNIASGHSSYNVSCVDLKGYLYSAWSSGNTITINKIRTSDGVKVASKNLTFSAGTFGNMESILFDYVNQILIINGEESGYMSSNGRYMFCDLNLNRIKDGSSRIVADGNGGYLGKLNSEVSLYDKDMKLIRTSRQVLYDNYRLGHDGKNNVYINGWYNAESRGYAYYANMNTGNVSELSTVYDSYKYFGDKYIHKIRSAYVDKVVPNTPNTSVARYYHVLGSGRSYIRNIYSNIEDIGTMKILF